MSIRQVNCPSCGAAANIPVAMANVRCPACGKLWNASNPGAAAARASADRKPAISEDEDGSMAKIAIVGSLVFGALFLMAVVGVGIVVLNRSPDPAAVAAAQPVEETIKPLEPEEYRVIDLPEEHRRRIYNDYRKVARTTVEAPLAVPQGWKIRDDLEDTLQKAFDRELMRFAALHDITVEDVKEVIKEGDAKEWDPSPRSHAVRDGKRVYAKEKSEGWKKNPYRK